jgi:hypothetical protein
MPSKFTADRLPQAAIESIEMLGLSGSCLSFEEILEMAGPVEARIWIRAGSDPEGPQRSN